MEDIGGLLWDISVYSMRVVTIFFARAENRDEAREVRHVAYDHVWNPSTDQDEKTLSHKQTDKICTSVSASTAPNVFACLRCFASAN